MKIAFYSPHLTVRGTETAMYDYAYYNEKILGNQSIIIYCDNNGTVHQNDKTAIQKFKNQFEVFQIQSDISNYGWSGHAVPLIDQVLKEQKCDVLYMQKGGRNDGVISKVCPTVILCASHVRDPHGSRYAYVSKWLSEHASNGELPWLPIIIDLPSTKENFRKKLGISEDAIVFGRTGGMDSWSIPWVNNVILETINQNKNIYFLFQNTSHFTDHPNIIHVETTADMVFKAMFINTCDAMIHAREDGESFGQAIAEFSVKNKPIITCRHPSISWNHILTLKEKGIYYSNPQELLDIFLNFKKQPELDWNCYKEHTPMNGIMKFKEILLDGLI
jgi:hypothetical protein